jgi:hypothetical protein
MHFQPLREHCYPQLPLPFRGKRAGQAKKEKTPSAASTRKSSSDSIDVRDKFKTEMCKYYLMQVECPFANCVPIKLFSAVSRMASKNLETRKLFQ